ncbi:MAG: hypothetical protein ACFFDT_34845 [Candidatus Hodarchaeota archaeon]
MPSNMYPKTKTWNTAVGCGYGCVYCIPSFQRQIKRVAGILNCENCRSYIPHYHPERLEKIPSAPIIFVFGTGDIYFYKPSYVRKTLSSIDNHRPRIRKTYYFQSKNPICFNEYLDWFKEHQEIVILLTTIESNRHYPHISKAPSPKTRFYDFLNIDYPRKAVTIEPALDFDPDIFITWFQLLKLYGLEYVWFGFDSKNCGLPEPSIEKAQKFVNWLQYEGIEVRGKSLRGIQI